MAILVNGVKVAGAGVPGQNATINGVTALAIEAVAPLLAQMSGSTLTLSLDGGAGVHVEAGSYVGTGTYGASNPNTILFTIDAKAVFVSSGASQYLYGTGFFWGGQEGTLHLTYQNKSLSWYAAASGDQLNISGQEYYWVAFG